MTAKRNSPPRRNVNNSDRQKRLAQLDVLMMRVGREPLTQPERIGADDLKEILLAMEIYASQADG